MIDYLLSTASTNVEQREEEGVEVAGFRERLCRLRECRGSEAAARAMELIDELEAREVPRDFAYQEPNDLKAIRELSSPVALNECGLSEGTVRDRVLGGWLGRAAGCLLGRPIEGTPLGHKRDDVRRHLEQIDSWPVDGYIGEPMSAIDPALPRPFPGMIRDDDIDYVLLNLLLVEQFGRDWNYENARQLWARHLSHDFVYAAARAAYLNFCLGMMPPLTATWGNPCRQSLGATIRCDTWGWISPGQPSTASEFAHRDARISQTTNGIYSGMFFAALIAAAFVVNDIERLIEIGLGVVPRASRFAEAVRFTAEAWNSCRDWDRAIGLVYNRYSGQYFNAAIINACIVVLGLLSGGGDFERTIVNTVISGFDADCTGATAGSVCGVMLGAFSLPAKWIDPLNDSYETFLAGLGVQRFTDLAERTSAIAVRYLE